MNYRNEYEKYKKLSTDELAEIMGGREEIASKANIARLVYEERQMEQQDRYNKEQIELQHKLNIALVKEQVKWVKYSAVITAVATILAALLGWYLGQESHQLKEQLRLKTELLQQIQLLNKSKTSDTHPEQTLDKAPSPSSTK